MTSTRKLQTCPHCERLVAILRGCGGMIGAKGEHYLMAAVIGVRNGGGTLEGVTEALRMIWEAEPSAASMGPPIRAQDVSVVDAAPGDAIDAFVAAQGARPA